MKNRDTHRVNEMMMDALNGKISRRDMFKRGTALGLSAPVMGVLLSAQKVGAQDATPPVASPSPVAGAGEEPGWSIEVPDWVSQLGDFSGQTGNVVLAASGPEEAWERAAIERFNEATGAQVQWVAGAQASDERLNQALQAFAGQSPDVDALKIDVIWPGIVADHALDLTDLLEEQRAEGVEHFDRIVENNTVDGKLVGIPWFTDAGILYYRTDLLEQYGFGAPPTTWAELEEMATTIIEGEAANNPSFTGFVFQGIANEGLTCNALEWQYSNGGGTIIDEEGTVTVNNPQAIEMFQTAQSWVGGIAPSGVTGYDEEGARGVWQGGNAAFMRNWPYAIAPGQEAGSPIAGAFDVTALPMGMAEGAQHAATLGGWQMMISAYSDVPDLMRAFVRYLTSPELQQSHAIEISLLPTIPAVYDDPGVQSAQPYFQQLRDVISQGAVARPATITADLYPQVSNAYFTSINQILTGADAQSTVEQLASQLEALLQA